MPDERDDSFLRAVAYVAPVEPTALDTPALGSVLGGKYQLEEAIGRGGMAVVFAARHQMTGKRVAVKWMRPQLARNAKVARRFLREARAAGSIDHPNVVAVHDAGTHRESPFLVMELLEGQTLRERMRAGQLEVDEAVDIAQAVIAGVVQAHKRGILHRDIKPDNVFLCAQAGRAPLPKVLDFGVSGVVNETSEVSTLTDHGTIVGTPGYMPLEQLQGTDELDERADVYAVGVLLYEMLTGQRPFPARTYGELIVHLATTEAPRPERLRPGLDPRLSAVVMKAIARERADRYPDLEAMAAALSALAQRNWGAIARAGGLALAGAAALSLLWLWTTEPEPQPVAASTPPAAPSPPAAETPPQPAPVAEPSDNEAPPAAFDPPNTQDTPPVVAVPSSQRTPPRRAAPVPRSASRAPRAQPAAADSTAVAREALPPAERALTLRRADF